MLQLDHDDSKVPLQTSDKPMKDASPLMGREIPPPVKRRGANSNLLKHMTTSEADPWLMENTTPSEDEFLRKKKKIHLKSPASKQSFEAAVAFASKEISALFSNYAEASMERAAADTSWMQELEKILAQAENIEYHLRGQKKHLRQTLDHISEQLQG